jgi:hypothetical protein
MEEFEERRVGDLRVEAIAQELREHGGRLSNIEAATASMQQAMQDMAKALVAVARVEERLSASHDYQQHMAGQIEELQKQVRQGAFERAASQAGSAAIGERSLWLERAFWIALTGTVAWLSNNAPLA